MIEKSTVAALGAVVAMMVGGVAIGDFVGHRIRDHRSSDTELVWCVAPGEAITPALKAEYPELRMSRAACDAVNSGSAP